MDTITITINGVERTYKGTHDEMMSNDWEAIMHEHLTDNGGYNDSLAPEIPGFAGTRDALNNLKI